MKYFNILFLILFLTTSAKAQSLPMAISTHTSHTQVYIWNFGTMKLFSDVLLTEKTGDWLPLPVVSAVVHSAV